MAASLVLIVTASVMIITGSYVIRLRASNRLTALRFSTVVAAGWGTALFTFCFLGLALASEIQLTSELILLGLGIVIINLLIAFPISFLLYRYVLSNQNPEVDASRK